jgi:histone deacetylase complex regulatory component SIN3
MRAQLRAHVPSPTGHACGSGRCPDKTRASRLLQQTRCKAVDKTRGHARSIRGAHTHTHTHTHTDVHMLSSIQHGHRIHRWHTIEDQTFINAHINTYARLCTTMYTRCCEMPGTQIGDLSENLANWRKNLANWKMLCANCICQKLILLSRILQITQIANKLQTRDLRQAFRNTVYTNTHTTLLHIHIHVHIHTHTSTRAYAHLAPLHCGPNGGIVGVDQAQRDPRLIHHHLQGTVVLQCC